MEFSGEMNIFEKFYLFFYLTKKRKDLKTQKKLPFPVISVGNLTVGGTGKTPFTIALAKELKKRGYKPVILTRGYRGRLKGPVVVTADEMNAEDAGDEPLMMAMEGLTVVKCADRYIGGSYAIKEGFTNKDRVVFILDDGFQYWKLYRDLNILLVDGLKGFGNLRLIPFGSLRSPLSEISEADFIFITKKKNDTLFNTLINMGYRNIFFIPLKVERIMDINGKEVKPDKKTAFLFAGIGNFESFKECLTEFDIKIIGEKRFIDHKNYSEGLLKKINRIAKDAELIVTTKKDFIKIKNKAHLLPRLCYLEVFIEIEPAVVDKILAFLNLF